VADATGLFLANLGMSPWGTQSLNNFVKWTPSAFEILVITSKLGLRLAQLAIYAKRCIFIW